MTQIIPVINASTWEEVTEKIKVVEALSDWVHIDVADGTITPNSLWHNPLDLVGLTTSLNIEIHLMEDRPEERVEAWLMEPVKRVIVHYEVTHDFDFILRECKKEGIEVGLSIAPHTSWSHLKPFGNRADMLQVLAVAPGYAGQGFGHENLSKIKHLRAQFPESNIEVDGGITPPVARECVRAGANILVSSSYIFNHPSPQMAIKELQRHE